MQRSNGKSNEAATEVLEKELLADTDFQAKNKVFQFFHTHFPTQKQQAKDISDCSNKLLLLLDYNAKKSEGKTFFFSDLPACKRVGDIDKVKLNHR